MRRWCADPSVDWTRKVGRETLPRTLIEANATLRAIQARREDTEAFLDILAHFYDDLV
jgi:hypothetical protein